MAFSSRFLGCLSLIAALLVFVDRALYAGEVSAGRTFSVLAASNADWTDFGVLNGSKLIPLSPSRQTRSPALPIPSGDDSVTFARRTVDPKSGKTIHVPVARAAVPIGATRILFILMPRVANDGTTSLEVVATDDGLKVFPTESLKVINATEVTFQGVLGRERMTFGPGSSTPVKTTAFIPPEEEAPDPGMPFGLTLATNEGVKSLYAAALSVSSHTRILVLVLPPKNPGSNRVQVRAIHQTIPPPAAGTPIAANR